MRPVGGDSPRIRRNESTSRASEAAPSKETASERSSGKTAKSDSYGSAKKTGEPTFPRASWSDVKEMRRATKKARAKSNKVQKKPSHPRVKDTKTKKTRPDKPPIAARYGLRPPSGGGGTVTPEPPPIAMRYGLRPPSGGGGTVTPEPPPIAMRYGLRPPINTGGGGADVTPEPPPIAMRYGLRPPSGGGSSVTPEPPPIAMRYGLRPPAHN